VRGLNACVRTRDGPLTAGGPPYLWWPLGACSHPPHRSMLLR